MHSSGYGVSPRRDVPRRAHLRAHVGGPDLSMEVVGTKPTTQSPRQPKSPLASPGAGSLSPPGHECSLEGMDCAGGMERQHFLAGYGEHMEQHRSFGSGMPPVILATQACVKVFCTSVAPCYALPWLRGAESHSCGSGFAVELPSGAKRILTNAQAPTLVSQHSASLRPTCAEAQALRVPLLEAYSILDPHT
eukprot:4228268-Pleurochrysis_carterae.AAC.4